MYWQYDLGPTASPKKIYMLAFDDDDDWWSNVQPQATNKDNCWFLCSISSWDIGFYSLLFLFLLLDKDMRRVCLFINIIFFFCVCMCSPPCCPILNHAPLPQLPSSKIENKEHLYNYDPEFWLSCLDLPHF